MKIGVTQQDTNGMHIGTQRKLCSAKWSGRAKVIRVTILLMYDFMSSLIAGMPGLLTSIFQGWATNPEEEQATSFSVLTRCC